MNKLKLLASTAVIVGAITVSTAVKAEDAPWYQSMTQSVKNWFAPQQETTAEMKAYLDEVTIAVPPMTGDEAARIEPAAGGDYQPTLEEALENNDDQSFNSAPVFSNNGSVAAFEDPISAEDLANIMPAAGDAEGIVDESIVVVEDDIAEDAAKEMNVAPDNLAEETQEKADEVDAVVKETILIDGEVETKAVVEHPPVRDLERSDATLQEETNGAVTQDSVTEDANSTKDGTIENEAAENAISEDETIQDETAN